MNGQISHTQYTTSHMRYPGRLIAQQPFAMNDLWNMNEWPNSAHPIHYESHEVYWSTYCSTTIRYNCSACASALINFGTKKHFLTLLHAHISQFCARALQWEFPHDTCQEEANAFKCDNETDERAVTMGWPKLDRATISPSDMN